MNVFNLKKEIEEKKLVLEELIKQCEKEEKKLFLLKNNKKISEIKMRIASTLRQFKQDESEQEILFLWGQEKGQVRNNNGRADGKTDKTETILDPCPD